MDLGPVAFGAVIALASWRWFVPFMTWNYTHLVFGKRPEPGSWVLRSAGHARWVFVAVGCFYVFVGLIGAS